MSIEAIAPDQEQCADRDVMEPVEPPNPSQRKWTPWHGGEMPIPEGTAVEVILRYGKQATEKAGSGYATRWSFDGKYGDHDDIVFYRPAEPSPQTHVAALEKEIKDLKHNLASAEGRAKNATSNCDYWKAQYEAATKNTPSPQTLSVGHVDVQAAINLGAAVLSKVEDPAAREVAIRNALAVAVAMNVRGDLDALTTEGKADE